MQATGTLRESGFSKGFILVVVAMVCALLVGAAGGYAARNVSSSGGTQVHRSVVDANQGGPQSDLTRALPTAAPNSGLGYYSGVFPGKAADQATNDGAGYDISQWQPRQPNPDFGPLP